MLAGGLSLFLHHLCCGKGEREREREEREERYKVQAIERSLLELGPEEQAI